MTHSPVLLKETIALLRPHGRDRILDVTVGLGGHAEALLSAAPSATLVGLDADPDNLARARERLKRWGGRVTLIHANFADLPDCLPVRARTFGVIVADLGVSSPHLDDPARGFSFRADGPLDMRYDRARGRSAATLLERLSERELTHILRTCGELRRARALASAVVRARREEPIATSAALVTIVQQVYGYRAPNVLAQVFQALRIAVNDELAALERLLSTIPELLLPGGRIAVISYHSLEDRRVKNRFRSLARATIDPVTGSISAPAHFALLTKRAVAPSAEEAARNLRSRSAHLRALRRIL